MIKTESLNVLNRINPWKAQMALPNTYRCEFCYGYIRVTIPPDAEEYINKHKENCVWRKYLEVKEKK